ncbi:hypothetical protein AMTRI_Chr10g6440 [Amborella trichopoda]
MKQVREVAYDAEDALNKFFVEINGLQRRSRPMSGLNFARKWIVHHRFAIEIQNIQKRVQEISDAQSRYGLDVEPDEEMTPNDALDGWKDPRRSFSYIEEADIVGIEKPAGELNSLLLEGEPKRRVLSVVGMGWGVYNSIKSHFSCCAWVTVSQTFRIVDLLESILKEFGVIGTGAGASNESETDIQCRLLNNLNDHVRNKSFLVVFDDVRQERVRNFINAALPESENGSRIIITAPQQSHSSYGRWRELHPLT